MCYNVDRHYGAPSEASAHRHVGTKVFAGLYNHKRGVHYRMEITKSRPFPLGAGMENGGVRFSYVSKESDCGIVLFDKDTLKEKQKISFPAAYVLGNVHFMHVSGISTENTAYCFYEKDSYVTDGRGRAFCGGHAYGGQDVWEKAARPALFTVQDYDWEGDSRPHIPYEECFCYLLHVRGFTRHASSKVKAKGTFAGLTEKIPYLKALGVTTLELQPVYEFCEVEKKKISENPYLPMDILKSTEGNPAAEHKLNYWGYTAGCYYSPKNSYAHGADAVSEFKDMVKALHQNGLEVVLQFYFTKEMPEREVAEILHYWVLEYHVDGFHLKGEQIPAGALAEDPALAGTKLWYHGFPEKNQNAFSSSEEKRYRAEYRDDYRYDMRRFLKGDEGMLPAVMYHLRHNPAWCGQINYLTNYDGFTLMDLVSYDRKHNESNGEEGKDGADCNASWNCGQEGRSRKKAVLSLRRRQIKNALLLLFLSQGTPLIFMGDEFGNTQNGNNNPYCQDNEITWLNWKNLESNREIFSFVKDLAAIRKSHPVLRQGREVRLMDYGACGYPDASYHGAAPWKPDTSVYSRQLGVMYCGKYAMKDRKHADDFFYIAYNMHWEPYRFALPKLPKAMCWEPYLASEAVQMKEREESGEGEQQEVGLPGRSICVLIGRKKENGGKNI